MPLTEMKVIDVTQYGAIGDGVADDTVEIQNAINDAVSLGWQSGIYYYSSPRLYFPPGKYKISDTLVLDDSQISLSIIGDDAVLVPNGSFDPEKYALTTDSAYNLKIKGLHFVGFAKAVNINAIDVNLNTSQLLIEECSFLNSKLALRFFVKSGLAVISKCKFNNNKIAMHIAAGDKVTVKDCWIEAGMMTDTIVGGAITETHPAQIINSAKLTVEGCVLTPHAQDATEPAWINNYASVTVKDTRQGGEDDSFTLINNFAPVAGDANAVIVKNCECYAVYGNTSDYLQPAALRYVTKIPNLSIIRNNRGFVDCSIVEFSKNKWGDSHSSDPLAAAAASAAITSVINNSGTSSAAVVTENVIVEVANNVRGVLIGGRTSFVPKELFPYVRDEESLWPATRITTQLEPVNVDMTSSPGNIIYKFEYADFSDTLLLKYSGNPHAGSGHYSGGYTGIIKSNGTYTSAVQQALRLYEIANEIGSPGAFFAGTYTVSVYWDATGNDLLPDDPITNDYNSNRFFYVKVNNQGIASLSRIKLIRLDKL